MYGADPDDHSATPVNQSWIDMHVETSHWPCLLRASVSVEVTGTRTWIGGARASSCMQHF